MLGEFKRLTFTGFLDRLLEDFSKFASWERVESKVAGHH